MPAGALVAADAAALAVGELVKQGTHAEMLLATTPSTPEQACYWTPCPPQTHRLPSIAPRVVSQKESLKELVVHPAGIAHTPPAALAAPTGAPTSPHPWLSQPQSAQAGLLMQNVV